MTWDISTSLQIISISAVVGAGIYAILRGIHYYSHKRERSDDEYTASFNTVIAQLSSDNPSSQLSAAILLRRFLSCDGKHNNLHQETINEISSLLRVLPTGIFQKTLGDGLAYAKNLSYSDFQKTNLQDVYLGVKQGRIQLTGADFFRADFSYANLDKIDGKDVQFMYAIFYNARIKNSDFSNANFYGSDLYRVGFKNTILFGADFSKALNIPDDIKLNLVDGKYVKSEPVTIAPQVNGKTIFFSMPGDMFKEDEILTKEYKRTLEGMGYEVIYYTKDSYPKFGQLNKVRFSIESSDAMIAFGMRQINISCGKKRIGTSKEENITNTWLPTPWNEIEVGMGLMAGLPILLVKDNDINSGVFDINLSECFVSTITNDVDCRKLETNQDFVNWRAKFSD